ncbi:hypothetical protein ACFL6Y_11450 [Elusimicrobiota bacterium]
MHPLEEPKTAFGRVARTAAMLLIAAIPIAGLGFAVYSIIAKPLRQVMRSTSIKAEREKQIADFDSRYNVNQDPFFRALPIERQKVVRETALYALMEKEIEGQTTANIAYKDLGPGLTLKEVAWLKKNGIVSEPRWPGYVTYRTSEGIFVLYPMKLLEEYRYEQDEQEEYYDDPY